MKNILIAVLAAVVLTACGPNPTNEWKTGSVSLETIKGLEDCSFHYVRRGGLTSPLYVVRCPNSSVGVTYREGKHDVYTSTIESDAPIKNNSNSTSTGSSDIGDTNNIYHAPEEQPLCLVGTEIRPCSGSG